MNMQTTVSVQDYLEPVTAIEGDYYALSSIASEILAHEKYLFTCKWFDYRFMTPFEATMTYVDAFAAVSRRIHSVPDSSLKCSIEPPRWLISYGLIEASPTITSL